MKKELTMKKNHGLGECNTGDGVSVSYSGTVGRKTYTLVIYEDGGRAACTPQSGDRYKLTISPDNTRNVGAVASITGTTLTLKPSNSTTTFTVTTTVTAEGSGSITSITGNVTFEDEKT
jgi:hypothetical protein